MSTPSRYVEDRDKLTDEEYFKAFQDKFKQVLGETKIEGYSLVRGINRRDDEDEDEDEDETDDGEKDKKTRKPYTKDEVDSIRYILMSKSRIAALKKAEKMVTRGQEDDCCQMYNTHDGNEVILDLLDFIKTAKRKRKLPDRFDAAIGLTIAANTQDCWMHDNEMYGDDGELQQVFAGMEKLWSSLLEHSDEDLGIDSTFTRPGAEELARKFAASAAEVALEHDCDYTCPWDAFKKKKAATAVSSPTGSTGSTGSTGKRGRAAMEQSAGAAKPSAKPAAKKPAGKKAAASTAAA